MKYRFFNKLLKLQIGLLLVACSCLMCVTTAIGESWAQRLGYPSDKKVVVLHAHDMGLCYESNAAAEKLLADGVVQSTSAMAPCPWFANCASWAKLNPTHDVGLQLTLNSGLSQYRWKPVAQHGLAASLVDSQGFLWPTTLQTTVNASVDDIEHELEAQLQQAKLQGLNPSHLTTHLGTLYSRLDFTEAYLRFARRNWIPAVVLELTPERIESFRDQGYPLPEGLMEVIEQYPLPRVDHLKFVPMAESKKEKREKTLDLFESLPNGLTQVAFAPAEVSEGLRRIDDRWQQRVWEFELFSDPKLADLLRSKGVIFTNWREIMLRFGGQ